MSGQVFDHEVPDTNDTNKPDGLRIAISSVGTTTSLLSSVTDAEGGVISYEYDWAGRLVKLTDQNVFNQGKCCGETCISMI